MKKYKYDIGLIGWWYAQNYGSMLTYYALNQVLTEMGYSVLMIHEALGYNGWRVKWDNDIPSLKFAKRQGYNITEQCHFSELSKYNDLCRIFINGSDQLWNPRIGRVNNDCFLDFVNNNKRKIAYATSFGNFSDGIDWNADFIKKNKNNLRRYSAVSVREDYAVDMAKNIFGIKNIISVIDPVFLLDKNKYDILADQATEKTENDYIFAFIINPSEEKKYLIKEIANRMNVKDVVIITDASNKFNEKYKDLFVGFKTIKEISPENFLYTIKNAKYVVTDSFHGICFSYIYRKNFSAFYNDLRGIDRFEYILNLLGIENRRIYENNLDVNLSQINYDNTEERVKKLRDVSYKWLKKSLKNPIFYKILLINVYYFAIKNINLLSSGYKYYKKNSFSLTMKKVYSHIRR